MQGSLGENLQSARNRIFWKLRGRLRFRRPGYRETGAAALTLSSAEARLERAYGLSALGGQLAETSYRKNLYTLWALERLLGPELTGLSCERVLEPGCQDFVRLPALRAFLRARGLTPAIHGIELDPFPILNNLHSRWDKAHYYASLPGLAPATYHDADFFQWAGPAADLVACFYPFVSGNPALAWGLPASFGNPALWVRAFERNLRPEGLLLVVHQGEWEEEEFDAARAGAPLKLLRREALSCPFYPLPHPACASVYRRE